MPGFESTSFPLALLVLRLLRPLQKTLWLAPLVAIQTFKSRLATFSIGIKSNYYYGFVK